MSVYKQIIVLYRTLFSFIFRNFKKVISKIKKTEAKYYFDSRQKLIAVVLLIVISGIFLFTTPAGAGNGILGLLISIISLVCYLLIMVFGWALTILISILIAVAQYNGFMTAQPVVLGWVLVRNICNMFFVIILLVVAFATVLGVQSYNYKSLLRKLIIMALLINFSKTITAFIIDFIQIIMLTFVNAFKDAGYNFTKILGLNELLSFSFKQNLPGNTVDDQNEISDFGVLAAMVLGLILVIVSSTVVLIFLLILIVRIVYLWLLMVLSPIAYFLTSFPGGQKYASKWWETFTQQLVVGPLLAFFLWLALATAQGGAGKINLEGVAYNPDESYYSQAGVESGLENEAVGNLSGISSKIPTEATQPANLLSFMIAITMLIVGLMLAQEVGGVAGSIAGQGLAKMRAVGTGKMGPTPMRWLRERGAAFRAQRGSARKTRATQFGEGVYARLEAAKGKVRAGRKAATSMVRSRGKETMGAAAGATADWVRKKAPPVGRVMDKGISLASKLRRDPEKRKAKQNIMSAISEMDEKKARGDKDSHLAEIDGQKFERMADGSIEVTKGSDKIMTKSETAVEYMQRYKQHYGSAQQIMDEIVKKKIDQRKGSFETLSPAELRRILTDTASSKNDKMAASMVMLAKEAFKGGAEGDAEFELAKQIVSKSPSMTKEWDEVADKRNGIRNNTVTDLEKKISNGTIDPTKFNTNQLNGENIITIERITGVKFKDTIKNMSKTTLDQKNIAEALKGSFESTINSKEGGDKSRRIAYAAVSGDLKGATTDTKGVDHSLIQEMITNAKSAQLAIINDENIEDPELENDFINSLHRAHLKGLQRSGETKQLNKFLELIKRKVGAGDVKAKSLQDNLNLDAELESIYRKIK